MADLVSKHIWYFLSLLKNDIDSSYITEIYQHELQMGK